MGRSVPSVLFSHSFRHHLSEEHVDEVRFSEPVVIAACEILAQQMSSACKFISFTGISTPGSFPVEVFVRNVGDARYRRLCQAFLYSASAPSIQDVQVSETDHLVLRGTYKSITLILYGGLASSIGQLSSDFGVDPTATKLWSNNASCTFEDLPGPLHPRRIKLEASISPLQRLRLVPVDETYKHAIQQILQLAACSGQSCLDSNSLCKVAKSLVSAVASLRTSEDGLLCIPCMDWCSAFAKLPLFERFECRKGLSVLLDAIKELEELVAWLQEEKEYKGQEVQVLQGCKELVNDDLSKSSGNADMVLEFILHWIQGSFQFSSFVDPNLFPVISLSGGLAAAQLLCADAQECYKFVKAGGMDLLVDVLHHMVGHSSASILLALGAVECASRYAFGCEAVLGWWNLGTSDYGANQEAIGPSKAYSILVKYLLQQMQQPVVQLASRVLRRLRAYELTAAIQSVVEIIIEAAVPSRRSGHKDDDIQGRSISKVTFLIKNLLGVLSVKDVALEETLSNRMSCWLALEGVDEETLFPPQATYDSSGLAIDIHGRQDIDPFLLSVLQERQFLPMVSVLVSAHRPRTSKEQEMNSWAHFMGVVEALLVMLLNCRSGVLFLASNKDVAMALVAGFQRFQGVHEKDLPPSRKEGSLNHPHDIGWMLHNSLSVICAVDRLLGAHEQSEDSLWALWELSAISKIENARHALLMLIWFPEVMRLLLKVFSTGAENSPPVLSFGQTWWLAAVHFVAEVLHVVFSDAVAPTASAWTPHATAMQHALLDYVVHVDGYFVNCGGHSEDRDGAYPGLLAWLDPAILYEKRGAKGLLKYISAVSAGGSGISQSTAGLPAMDNIEIDPNVGDASATNEMPNLNQGKWASMEVPAPPLSVTATVQMTFALRILVLVSHHPGVAGVLHGEGAIAVVCSILDQCSTALNVSSSAYDAVLDEDMEEYETAEDLGGDRKEHLVLGLLLPSVLFLLTLLRTLQITVHNYQNTKLFEVLVSLHHWISSRCAAYVSVPPYGWSGITQSFTAVRQVLVSVLVCWPIFGWTPSLFPRLLGMDNSSSTLSSTLLATEPSVTCSLLFLLADMLPQEIPQLCKSKSSLLDICRRLAVDSTIGVQRSSSVTWHTKSPYSDKLLGALVLHMSQITEVVASNTSTTCGILQDMLKIFIIRLSCVNSYHSTTIVQVIVNQIRELSSHGVYECENSILQGERILQIVAGLALHPSSKRILLNVGVIEVLLNAYKVQSQSSTEDPASTRDILPSMGWCLWIVRIFTALCDPDVSLLPSSQLGRRIMEDCPSFANCCSIVSCLLSLFQVAPLSKEFEVVLDGFQKLSSHRLGRAAIGYISVQRQQQTLAEEVKTIQQLDNDGDLCKREKGKDHLRPIFLELWWRMSDAMESGKFAGPVLISIVQHFAVAALVLSSAGTSSSGVSALKLLFGLCLGPEIGSSSEQDKLKPVANIVSRLQQYMIEDGVKTKPHEDMSGFASVPVTAIQEAYRAIIVMLRIIKRHGTWENKKTKSHLEVPDFSETCLTGPQEPDPQPYVCMACALVSWAKLDFDLEEDTGISNECPFPTEKHAGMCQRDSRFVWECCSLLHDQPDFTKGLKRKTTEMVEVSRKRQTLEFLGASPRLGDGTLANGVSPSLGRFIPTVPVLSRRDTFRQRKPNTSRPPSIHVDDYVARERNEGITTGSSPASVQRSIFGSGRPPSIHVDEFMARQQVGQHCSGTEMETDEQLSASQNEASRVVSNTTKDNPHSILRISKVWEEEDQVIPVQVTDEDKQSEYFSVAVQPGSDSDCREFSPSVCAQSTSAGTRSNSMSGSPSLMIDSGHVVKTPQVADMLLLQSKVNLRTAVAQTWDGVLPTLTEDSPHGINSTAAEHLHVLSGSKISSVTVSGSPSLLDKRNTVVPLYPLAFQVPSSSIITSSPTSIITLKQESESQTAKILQGDIMQSSSMYSPQEAMNPGTRNGGFVSLGSREVGLQWAGQAPSESQSNSVSPLLGREDAVSFAGLNPRNLLQSVFSVRDVKLLPYTAGHSTRQSHEPASSVSRTVFESPATSLLAQPSVYAIIPHRSSQAMEMTFPMASKEQGLVLPISASDSGSAVALASDANPQLLPLDQEGERTTDTFQAVVTPNPYHPMKTWQCRQELTLPVPFVNLLSAQPNPQSYTELAGLQPPWPSGVAVAKGNLPQTMGSPWSVQVPNLHYLSGGGLSYGTPGRPLPPAGNPHIPVGSVPWSTRVVPPSTPSLTIANLSLENLPGTSLSGLHMSSTKSTFPSSVPALCFIPSIRAQRPCTPHVQSLSSSISTQCQVPVPMPASSHPQQESPAILQQMLASPEAIQALLKDQNKLRELLEQHPKLISLLQERMSHAPS